MKILILRFSSIGDIVLTTPIVRCLKEQVPDAEIHYLTKHKFRSLLEHNPYIDKLHTFEEGKLAAVTQSLKSLSIDLIVDLHKNTRTRKIKTFLGTKSLSFKKLNVQKWLFVNFKINLLPDKHIVDRYFVAIDSLGVMNDQKGIDFFTAPDLANTEALSELPDRYFTVAIGGTYHTKQISAELILTIHKRLNLPLVLLGGGESDAKKAIDIVNNSNTTGIINMVNRLSINESALAIKNSKGLITGDTGLMHIASAYSVPIHSIWGNTHPDFGMYAYRPKSENIYNHKVRLGCNPCSKLGSDYCPRGHFHCMKLQNVEQIVKNCTSADKAQ